MSSIQTILQTKSHQGIVSTSPHVTVLSAVDQMCSARVGALLVMTEHRPVGIVSERDLLTRVLLKRRDPATTRVGDVMTRDVVAVREEATLEEAMAIMTERRFRHLPVIGDSQLTGIISIGDLVRSMAREQASEATMLRDYVMGRYPS